MTFEKVSIQFTVNLTNSSIFNVYFSKLYFTPVGIISYKRLCILLKEVGVVLVSRNSAAITFTLSTL